MTDRQESQESSVWRHQEWSAGVTIERLSDEEWAALRRIRYMREPLLGRAWRMLRGLPRPLTPPAMIALIRSRQEAAIAEMARVVFRWSDSG